MLGSVQDAEDALQEAWLRAWRGLERFEGRSSLRSWLYTIATNCCLRAIERRKARVLPVDLGPAADAGAPLGAPLLETVWVEPYPEPVDDGLAAPDARYELRESVELAFVAALQQLPGTQRAVLILRDVLGFSARETAEALDTSVASANSALQRARAAIEQRAPERSQQATLRALGDDAVRALVERYMAAWERADIRAVVAMLAEEATFAMPPLASWYRGREDIAEFLAASAMSGRFRWRMLPASASGQPAVAYYHWDDAEAAYLPFALNVLTLRDDGEIADVTAFIVRARDLPSAADYETYPEQRPDPAVVETVFRGLPDRLA
jgi:RNA polymerase sigma-70 factor, ECF subfamily